MGNTSSAPWDEALQAAASSYDNNLAEFATGGLGRSSEFSPTTAVSMAVYNAVDNHSPVETQPTIAETVSAPTVKLNTTTSEGTTVPATGAVYLEPTGGVTTSLASPPKPSVHFTFGENIVARYPDGATRKPEYVISGGAPTQSASDQAGIAEPGLGSSTTEPQGTPPSTEQPDAHGTEKPPAPEVAETTAVHSEISVEGQVSAESTSKEAAAATVDSVTTATTSIAQAEEADNAQQETTRIVTATLTDVTEPDDEETAEPVEHESSTGANSVEPVSGTDVTTTPLQPTGVELVDAEQTPSLADTTKDVVQVTTVSESVLEISTGE
jgi:hypothetical protein